MSKVAPVGKVTGYVYELEHDGANLLVGGSFTGIDGTTAKNVASFNGTTWTALSFPNVTVYALARDANNVLYAGGAFQTAGGVSANVSRPGTCMSFPCTSGRISKTLRSSSACKALGTSLCHRTSSSPR